MANGFMNPFGTQASIPFLFGEDQASQEALMAQQEAGNVAQQLVGLQDPRSEETIASADPMFGSAGPLATFLPGNVGSLKTVQGLSRFLPSLTRAPKQLPATTSQLPVPRIPRAGGPKRVEGTVINPLAIPKTSGSNVLPSLATLGLGTALVTDQLMQDTNAVQEGTAPMATTPQRAKSPLEIHTEYLKNLEEQGVSADERTQIAAQMIAPFLRDPAIQAESDAAFKAASAQRMKDVRDEAAARQATVEAARGGESSEMSLSDYRQLARQAGIKGSAVNAMAKQMQQEAETKAKKAETDIAATEALVASRGAPKATAYDKAEQIIDRLIAEGRIKPDQKDTLLLRALRLERNTGGDFGAIEKLLEVDSETVSNSNQNDLVTISAIDGQPV
jgi:hypothetical protein